jgi:hypothetical protein
MRGEHVRQRGVPMCTLVRRVVHGGMQASVLDRAQCMTSLPVGELFLGVCYRVR